jgi:Ni/Fe-hydrogenase subunit HybB-like protein
MKNSRVTTVKTILWFITGLASTIMIFRLIKGLGVTTNLTDKTPWGFWIGFDVLSGVALAAGGFVICATVYIFHLDKYRPLSRPAVLTAFLGYIAVAVGLFFDLGLPWRIWHPLIYWQPHSALFEVAWCVMLYLTVLLLEFSPVVLEKIPYRPFSSILEFLKRFSIIFVILGIGLSVLHQSSLGTLFMIMPERLHPLWYSSIQPLLFFVSAVGLGMGMVTLESSVTSWLYKREPETKVLQGLGRAIPYVLMLYVLIRLGELGYKGHLKYIFDGSWESVLFIFELLISAIIPALFFAIPKIRKSKFGLVIGASMIVIGFVLHRIDVGIIASFQVTGSVYVPSFMEIMTSLGIVSLAVLAFLFFVEHFSVYQKEESGEEAESLEDIDIITDGKIFNIGFGDERRYSLVFILGAALAIFFLPANGLWGVQPEKTPVHSPRIVVVDSVKTKSQVELVKKVDQSTLLLTNNFLLIDGNRDQRSVLFDHGSHIIRNGGKDSCGKCHHMNLTLGRATECYQCHQDMYLDTDIFDHNYHMKVEEGNKGCHKCHTDMAKAKNRETSIQCSECHKSMEVSDSFIKVEDNWKGMAPGYMNAMHGLCLKCHEAEEKKMGKPYRIGISNCRTCHTEEGAKLYATSKPDIENNKNK